MTIDKRGAGWQASYAQRMRDLGLVRVSLWVRPQDKERVLKYARHAPKKKVAKKKRLR